MKKHFFLLCFLLMLTSSCSVALQPDKTELHQLVYGNRRQSPDEYTVYIQEDGVYEPYLVIDGNYGGGVLLLRKYLTEEAVAFCEGQISQYYPVSDIDKYLNTMFIEKLAPALQEMILDTSICVATVDSHLAGSGYKQTENIQRKVFLLSVTEMDVLKYGTSTVRIEGEPLVFYKHGNPISATHKNGETNWYWLRSRYFSQGGLRKAWMIYPPPVIGPNTTKWGGGSNGINTPYPLRPAFCLSPDTPIEKMDLDGEMVYIVSQ
jgi:hypothetical protein